MKTARIVLYRELFYTECLAYSNGQDYVFPITRPGVIDNLRTISNLLYY